ncbi:Aste57867_16828 [Aphanomyces stellatus]|uniref:Aste57867_16828 protein n=1 Tax=Aphanomyces stellatus TaxID=120398 RepID=A0A485L7I3_9STRA|nr:hypothetical protein As57867_016770 [Aphanomyces stellatus]VFT93592.1 Aste57867_16828 [Aphanomyces stellatus]
MIICGPPAGGKGTQCERLVDLFGVVHLSTGDMLRAAIHANSDVGRQAKRFMDVGELVPDSLIVDVILDRLTQPDCLERGWLLDGFPRTQGQAQAMLATGIVPDLVVVLDVPDDEVVSRIAGRRVDLATGKTYHVTFNPPPPDVEVVQRSDDNEETIRVRLATYHTHCDAVVESFEGRESTTVIHIDGMRGKEAATETIQSTVETIHASWDGGSHKHLSKVSPKPKKPQPPPPDGTRHDVAARNVKKGILRQAAAAVATEATPTFVLLGPPAAGKGTQCELLARQFGVVHLSTGEMLRAAIRAGSTFGRKVAAFMDAGALVPDELVTGTVLELLKSPESTKKGWLLDGFPRTEGQAQAMLAKGLAPDIVILLDVPDDDVLDRAAGRRLDVATGRVYHLKHDPPPVDVEIERRADDTDDAVRAQLTHYHAHSKAIADVMATASRIVRVDGRGGKDEVATRIRRALQSKLPSPKRVSVQAPVAASSSSPKRSPKTHKSLAQTTMPGIDPAVVALYTAHHPSPPKSKADVAAAFTSWSTPDHIRSRSEVDVSMSPEELHLTQEIHKALLELKQVQLEGDRLKQEYVHKSQQGGDARAAMTGGQKELDVVVEKLLSERTSLVRVTKRQKESIDANEWEALLQRTMTELDAMRKKIQHCKRRAAEAASTTADGPEAQLKALQQRHDQLKAKWRQRNQPTSIATKEQADQVVKWAKKEASLRRTDDTYYTEKTRQAEAHTANELARMQDEIARLRGAVEAAQGQYDACVAECRALEERLPSTTLPKLPKAAAAGGRHGRSHAAEGGGGSNQGNSLPPIYGQKPHTGDDSLPKTKLRPPAGAKHMTARGRM